MSPTSAGGRARLALLLAAGLVFFLLPALLSLAADWQWFGEVGYLQILTLSVTAEVVLGGAVFVVAMAWLWVHLRVGLETLAEEPISYTTREGFTVALPSRAQLRPLATLAALIVSFLLANYAASAWLDVLTWWKHVPFGDPDPILGRNARSTSSRCRSSSSHAGSASAWSCSRRWAARPLYAMAGAAGADAVRPSHRRSASGRTALCWPRSLFLLLALGAWLERAEQLISTVRHHPGRQLRRRARADAGGAGAGRGGTGRRRAGSLLHAIGRARPLAGRRRAISTASSSSAAPLYADVIQRFVVAPNEQAREAPYIAAQHRRDAAGFGARRGRGARALRRCRSSRATTSTAIAQTLDNVRLWDHQPLLETFGQIQEIRTYYDFIVGGQRPLRDSTAQPRQVMLSAREMNPGGAAQPHLGQRAARLHARARAHARAGQPGHRARACRSCSSATCRRCPRSTSM